ncbi:MAG: YtxH domain-containing protein [Actinobacteria bacterium]|nr:YtxH domain-containing protein [Actinomycetota bacterium]
MSFRTGLVVGFGVGYVLGAKAGRARYEQIRTWWDRFSGDPRVQELTERGKSVAAQTGRRGFEAIQTGVEKASASVRARLHGDGNGQAR